MKTTQLLAKAEEVYFIHSWGTLLSELVSFQELNLRDPGEISSYKG